MTLAITLKVQNLTENRKKLLEFNQTLFYFIQSYFCKSHILF